MLLFDIVKVYKNVLLVKHLVIYFYIIFQLSHNSLKVSKQKSPAQNTGLFTHYLSLFTIFYTIT